MKKRVSFVLLIVLVSILLFDFVSSETLETYSGERNYNSPESGSLNILGYWNYSLNNVSNYIEKGWRGESKWREEGVQEGRCSYAIDTNVTCTNETCLLCLTNDLSIPNNCYSDNAPSCYYAPVIKEFQLSGPHPLTFPPTPVENVAMRMSTCRDECRLIGETNCLTLNEQTSESCSADKSKKIISYNNNWKCEKIFFASGNEKFTREIFCKEGESCVEKKDENGNIKGAECRSPVTSCSDACKEFQTDQISFLIERGKIKEEDIKSICTGQGEKSYNFDNADGKLKFKEEVLDKIYPDKIPDELIWRTETIEKGDDKNGDNYCIKTYGGKGLFNSQQDCVCYAAPECIDEDKDGYGKAGTYTFMCSKKEEDCWDNTAMNWGFEESKGLEKLGNSMYKSELLSLYKTLMDKNKNNDIADEVNPGQDELFSLYNGRFFKMVPVIFGGPYNIDFYVSACTDGIDNDCDGHTDCFDSGCAIEGDCQNTCGEACVEKYPAAIGARCADNPLTVPTEEIRNGKKYKFETLESKDYSDCPKEKACVCILSDCEAVCANHLNSIATKRPDGSLSHIQIPPKFRNALANEKQQSTCFNSAVGIKDNYAVFKTVNNQNNDACCCGICEKMTGAQKDSEPGFFEKLFGPGFKTELLKRVKEDNLFADNNLENGKPYLYDEVIGKMDNYLNGFLCSEVVQMLKDRDLNNPDKSKRYALYSVGIIKMMQDNIILGNSEIRYFFKGKEFERSLPIGLKDENYRNGFNNLLNRAWPTLSNLALDTLKSGKIPEGCKICPVLSHIEGGKRNSFSYFVPADMIENISVQENYLSFNGEGYSAEPHGLVFLTEFRYEYLKNETVFIFDEGMLENCSIRNLSETTNFLVSSEETNLTYEYLIFRFPDNAVYNNTDVYFTKVEFNCSIKLDMTPLEPYSLIDVLKSAKKWTLREILLEDLKRLLERWKWIYESNFVDYL